MEEFGDFDRIEEAGGHHGLRALRDVAAASI